VNIGGKSLLFRQCLVIDQISHPTVILDHVPANYAPAVG
jgi:hypothetical protein